ncbi:hypothetical protein D3C86_982300 [compost metagenome]
MVYILSVISPKKLIAGHMIHPRLPISHERAVLAAPGCCELDPVSDMLVGLILFCETQFLYAVAYDAPGLTASASC